MNIQVISPLDYPDWNHHISDFKGATIFHTTNWARVLADSYGYKPLYFSAFDGHRLRGCIPLMGIKSCITGCRGVALPFSDECKPLGNSKSVQSIWRVILSKIKRTRWSFIELRGASSICESEVVNSTFKTHTIDLDTTESQLLRRLRNSTRRNISKAKNNHVTIQISRSMNAVKAFYRLHCMTRQRHGIPPQPTVFFKKIHEHILAEDMGFILIAVHKGSVIAAAVYLTFNGMAIYKFGASDLAFQLLRANNLVMWSAIKLCIDRGLNCFHFGRTELSNSGLMQFKRGWGAEEKNLYYYKFETAKKRFVADRNGYKYYNFLFKKMPLPMLKLSGRFLYKHVG